MELSFLTDLFKEKFTFEKFIIFKTLNLLAKIAGTVPYMPSEAFESIKALIIEIKA